MLNDTPDNATVDHNDTKNTKVAPKVLNKYPRNKYSNTYRNVKSNGYNKYYRNSRYNKYSNHKISPRRPGYHVPVLPLTKEKYILLITLYSEYFSGDMSFSDFVAILKLNGIEIATLNNWDENGEITIEFDNLDEVPDTIEIHDNSNNVQDYTQNINKDNVAGSSGEIDGGDIEVETTSKYHSQSNVNSNTNGNSYSDSSEEAAA